MTLKRRISYFLFLFVFAAFFLAACGKKEELTEALNPDELKAGFTTTKDYVVTTKDETVIYRLPDTMSEKYTTVKAGVNLRRTGIKEGWNRIRLNDTILYVESGRVKLTEMKWAEEKQAKVNTHVVFIDPAKQIYADAGKEPLFPDSERPTKQKMTKGAIGTATGTFEYELTLNMAEQLKHELELRGYTVILSRVSSTISLSNAERAVAGNASEAEIMIRLAAQSSAEAGTNGILGFVAPVDEEKAKYYQSCFYLANAMLTESCLLTEQNRLGIIQTADMTFLNYARKPAAVIEMGFLSNEEEDRRLSDAEYQKLMVRGLANGIDSYFAWKDEQEESKDQGEAEPDSEQRQSEAGQDTHPTGE
ncbi:MAG: N-acetylmuramoyl-L-alanine amidase [Eubacterium sp.]|nr:N-acetylmuramoyl-L-alanine amidase [Eubacterium sp.]